MSTKKRKYGLKSRFTMETLLEATERVKAKEMTTRQASVAYNIPRTTLVNKLHLKHMKSVGRPCILTDAEEESLVQNIFACIESGLRISPKDVRYMVKDYLDRSDKTISFLRNNMPSLEWSKMFLDRHEDLKSKISYERKRKNVTQKILRRFFYALERDLENILPENIFNFIELKFCDNCKTNAVVYRKQDLSTNAIKSDFTVIFCANALGYMTPPYIIHKGTSKGEEWLLGAPTGTKSFVTLNGWLNEEAFSDWFHKIVLPLAAAKDGNKILIGDRLSCHPSDSVRVECQKYNIKIIQFPSNTTHILQPLEIKYVKTLRTHWWAILNAWKNTIKGQQTTSIPKAKFSNLLNKTLRLGKSTYRSKIITGFKESGIYPINEHIVLKKTSCSKQFLTRNRDSLSRLKNIEEDTMLDETQNLQLNKYDKIVVRETNTSESQEIDDLEIDPNKNNFSFKNTLDLIENESDGEYIIEILDTVPQETDLDDEVVLSEGSFCLINFECSLFPAKVININEEFCDLIVMRKYYFGWSLPTNLNSICQSKIEDIVKVLNFSQVVKTEYGFQIHDEDLNREWED